MVINVGKQVLNRPPESDEFSPLAEPAALYLHWPYCVHKCPYCDFNSHVARAFSEAAYVEAIRRELDHMAKLTSSPVIASVFFGGGTPSLMAPSSVAAILDHIRSRFALAPDAEITLEANPSSSEAARFAQLHDAGINRLSLGVQALDDDALRLLERPHDLAEALQAIEAARRIFPRMSFDLIYARHGQQLDPWRAELARALDLCNGHLSAYTLTIEAGTRYHALHAEGRIVPPVGELAEQFYDATLDICAGAGLAAYEISNFARPGEQCRHNLAYWRYRPYIGVGPGAHGRLASEQGRIATATLRSPKRWHEQVMRRGHGLEVCEPLSAAEEADERLLMGLRLRAGIDLAALQTATGRVIGAAVLEELSELGLCRLSADGRHLVASDQGFKLLNPLIERLSMALEIATPPARCSGSDA